MPLQELTPVATPYFLYGLSAVALLSAGGPQASGAIGHDAAAWLERYLSFGGSLMVLSLAIICGAVLLVERAPTDLLRGIFGRWRRPRGEPGA